MACTLYKVRKGARCLGGFLVNIQVITVPKLKLTSESVASAAAAALAAATAAARAAARAAAQDASGPGHAGYLPRHATTVTVTVTVTVWPVTVTGMVTVTVMP
jgi:hypothetical protein